VSTGPAASDREHACDTGESNPGILEPRHRHRGLF
jgi:hypothetical protein